MSISSIKIAEPVYYHREYANDFPDPSDKIPQRTFADECQRVAVVALPFSLSTNL